ncbi:MAG: hypothetical protein EOM73_03390 [Bacteroidia bacterium]|nr:hypothetical protein [Bacteroidia bacterium]
MKKIVILGSGMVTRPMTDYILNQNFNLTIATRNPEEVENLMSGQPNGKAVSWIPDDEKLTEELIATHDLTVSLLPGKLQIAVARICIRHKKPLVTTTHVSSEMKDLDGEAKKAGIILLHEMGFAPGFEYMTAMQLIDKVQQKGGIIREMYSLNGALAAPEETNNPFRHKFSESPRETIRMYNHGARFLKNGTIKEIPADELFTHPASAEYPGLGKMEIVPHRDSINSVESYHLAGIQTLYRGKFHYPNWCEIMNALKSLGLICTVKRSFEGKTYNEIVAEKMGVYPRNVKEKVAEKLNLGLHSPALDALEWLGVFSKERVHLKEGSTFDLTTDLMQKKMMLPEGRRDMNILLHSLLIEKAGGQKEVVRSRLLAYGTETGTSIAKIGSLSAAIAAKLILNRAIPETGVVVPISPSIYQPVLSELESMGISAEEKWGLPETECMELI